MILLTYEIVSLFQIDTCAVVTDAFIFAPDFRRLAVEASSHALFLVPEKVVSGVCDVIRLKVQKNNLYFIFTYSAIAPFPVQRAGTVNCRR